MDDGDGPAVSDGGSGDDAEEPQAKHQKTMESHRKADVSTLTIGEQSSESGAGAVEPIVAPPPQPSNPENPPLKAPCLQAV